MRDINFLLSKGVDVNSSLELFGDMETYNDTIGEFLVGMQSKLEKLENYKTSGDMANYAIYVHSLKSDAKYFGFKVLADMSYDHEMKSKANDYYYISNNFETLKSEVLKTIEIVKEYIEGEESSTDVLDTEILSDIPVYKKETILVVDDSNIVRNFVEKIFSERYDIGTAEDGGLAIDILKANKDNNNIVCVLLDLNMPRVDGFKVLDFMKENNLFVTSPVSIISGESSKEAIERAFTYQIVDLLNKPFNADDVKRVVEKNLYYKEMNK